MLRDQKPVQIEPVSDPFQEHQYLLFFQYLLTAPEQPHQ
jgi:hypothetical protein